MNRETAFNMSDQALANVEMLMRQADEQRAGLSKELAELDARRFDLQRTIDIVSQTAKALQGILDQNLAAKADAVPANMAATNKAVTAERRWDR